METAEEEMGAAPSGWYSVDRQQRAIAIRQHSALVQLGARCGHSLLWCALRSRQFVTWVRCTANMPDLQEEDATLGVHRFYDGLPSLDVLLGVDAGRVWVPGE